MKVLNSDLQVVANYSGPMVRFCFTETMEAFTPSKLDAKKYGTIMLKTIELVFNPMTMRHNDVTKIAFQDFFLEEIDRAIAKGAFEDDDNEIYLVGKVVLLQSFTPFYVGQVCSMNPEKKEPALVDGRKVYRHTLYDPTGEMKDDMNFVNPHIIKVDEPVKVVSWKIVYTWPNDKIDAYFKSRPNGKDERAALESHYANEIQQILSSRKTDISIFDEVAF